ncbi:MAG: replication initiator [Gaiellaceae bacterium]
MATACSHPIRLRGWQERIDAETGELLAQIVTAREPGGVLLVACGDRRAASCPSCAELYKHDAFQLVAAGLRGGKGVPDAVAGHPAVMVTLTAPSFGPVHTIRDRDGSCPCGGRHPPDDDALGTPVNPSTYRYLEQAVWNHLAPTLWKRTVLAIRRNLACELGVARHRLGSVARIRFVKAAEFQRRGTVHYHAVIRLDGPGKHVLREPPARCTFALLERVTRDAARRVEVSANGQRVRWGRELEIVRLNAGEVGRAAGYVAKYATKATEIAADGLLLRRVRSWRELIALDAPEHAKRLVEAAWRAGSIEGLERARRWAHQFGYGGHTLTKSHDYSVTFGALRDARAAWRTGQPLDSPGNVITRGKLKYAGRGWHRGAGAR